MKFNATEILYRKCQRKQRDKKKRPITVVLAATNKLSAVVVF